MFALTTTTQASAVTTDQVVAAAQAAYTAYKKFFSGELTLNQATSQILNAIEAAKTEINEHIDQIAASDVQACTRDAITDLPEIKTMTVTSRQQFASDATHCVDLAYERLGALDAKDAIDQVGFAVDTVGPASLLARSYVGYGVSSLKSTLIGANQRVIAKLEPSCTAKPNRGDAEPGEMVEVILTCVAYNKHLGRSFTYISPNQPPPTYNYSKARQLAMADTSYNVAKASLPLL